MFSHVSVVIATRARLGGGTGGRLAAEEISVIVRRGGTAGVDGGVRGSGGVAVVGGDKGRVGDGGAGWWQGR